MLALLLAVPLLVFHGNVGLVEDVYRTVLDLPAGTKATPATARAVASRLQKFLHDSGYVLATVRARAEGEQIVVDVDEGRLDKIIFLGGGAFETLRLRLALRGRDAFADLRSGIDPAGPPSPARPRRAPLRPAPQG